MKLPREFYIPKGAVAVHDKQSDAVAYLYQDSQGRPCAALFVGKQSKPLWRYRFGNEARREASVRAGFDARRARAERKAAERAEARAYAHTFKVGDVLNTCWGYEQTNREFFEVVEVRGRMLVLREIAQERRETGWARGECVPLPGQYVGEPIRRVAGLYGVRIDQVRHASKSDTVKVGGVDVVKPIFWTAYH